MAKHLSPLRKQSGGKLIHKTVSIGTATSYNVTSLCPKYKELTTANFAVTTQGYGNTRTGYKNLGQWKATLDMKSTAWHTAPGISSYNASSGIVYTSQGKSGGRADMYANNTEGELTLGVTLHIFYME